MSGAVRREAPAAPGARHDLIRGRRWDVVAVVIAVIAILFALGWSMFGRDAAGLL